MIARRSLATFSWLTLFAVGFGYVEGAVVIYLRRLYYPHGFDFPLQPMGIEILDVERWREFATLLMLIGAACLAAKSRWGRFGLFAVAFGVWDLAFYGTLKWWLDWPADWSTWDVLFLLPKIWTGPVWSPCLISLLLIACGALLFEWGEADRLPRLNWREVSLGILSLALLLWAFIANHDPVWRGERPIAFPTVRFLAGLLLGVAAFVHLARRRRVA